MAARISIIVAVGKNRAIGKKNTLLWRISDDLKRFKTLTMGHPIIMGRKTFESIGRALPGRTNIVITRNTTWSAPDCVAVHSLSEAFEFARTKDSEEIFVIGGGEIYKEALRHADRLYLTLIDDATDGDVHFPDYSDFTKVISEEKRFDEKTKLNYSWITLEK